MILKLLLCFLIHLTAISSYTIAPEIGLNENYDCLSHNGLEGKCILIASSLAMQRCLHHQEHRPTVCSWDRRYPIVCCPLVSLSVKREDSPELTTEESVELTTEKWFELNTEKLSVSTAGESYELNTEKWSKYTVIEPSELSTEGSTSATLRETFKCGYKVQTVHTAVFGGDEVRTDYDWPWIAALFQREGSNFKHFCGGTIIHESYILTAAHCVNDYKNQVKSVFVGIGATDLERTVKISIEQIIIHPNYTKSGKYFDIALLMTSTPITFNDKIIPICLPDSKLNDFTDNFNQYYLNVTIEVAGWGLQAWKGQSDNKLREARLEIIPHSQCNESYYGLNHPTIPEGIKTDQLCAGTTNGEKDSCPGDSGGPLTLLDFSSPKKLNYFGAFYQIGVVSFGYECGTAEFPGVYTKLSDYIPWIEQTIENANS